MVDRATDDSTISFPKGTPRISWNQITFEMKYKKDQLASYLESGYLKGILITGRTLNQGTSLEVGKTSRDYLENVAVIMMSEADMRALGVEEGKPVRVSTELGSVVVRCKKAKLDSGVVFMPFGPWVSVVLGSDTQGTGMPSSKGVEVEISATDEEVQTLPEILKLIEGR